MERLLGPNLEIILSLSEGHDFGFLSTPFVIAASLNGNTVETNIIPSEQNIKFNSEFIWLSNKSNIKKMRNYKVPIRLDFLKIDTNGSRTSFGYLILSLKIAQYIPKGDAAALREEVAKVVGLGMDAKGSSPQVKYSLRIQDSNDIDDVSSARQKEEGNEALELACTRSESSINVLLPVEEKTKEPTSPLCVPKQIKFPQEGNDVEVYHTIQLDIALEEMQWHECFHGVHLRFHHARADVNWSAHADIIEASSGELTNLRNVTAQFRFVEVPIYLNALLMEVPPVVSICTLRHGRPLVLAKSSLHSPTVEKGILKDTATFLDLKSNVVVASLSYTATITDLGPHSFGQLLSERGEDSATDRARLELEIWKEKEKSKLEEESKEKLNEELLQLRASWNKKSRELEVEAKKRIEEVNRLSAALMEASKIEKDREKLCDEREKKLEETKKDIESKYKQLLEETKKETACLREDLLERLKEKDDIISGLQKENEGLRKMIQDIKLECSALTRQQVEVLLQETRMLQEKLERANTSKLFFKEQWGRAVREVHRIKSDGWKDIKVQLQYKKDELKQMGLEYLFCPDNQGLPNQGPPSGSPRESQHGDHDKRSDERLRKLIEERDLLLLSEGVTDNEEMRRLNRDIRQFLEI